MHTSNVAWELREYTKKTQTLSIQAPHEHYSKFQAAVNAINARKCRSCLVRPLWRHKRGGEMGNATRTRSEMGNEYHYLHQTSPHEFAHIYDCFTVGSNEWNGEWMNEWMNATPRSPWEGVVRLPPRMSDTRGVLTWRLLASVHSPARPKKGKRDCE